MTCEWRDIIGYEGIYQVSNTGQVRSLERWNGHKRVKRESPYIMSQSTTTTGYKKKEEFKRLVRNGATNAEMAAQFRCPKTLIARMKYKMKKGDYGE